MFSYAYSTCCADFGERPEGNQSFVASRASEAQLAGLCCSPAQLKHVAHSTILNMKIKGYMFINRPCLVSTYSDASKRLSGSHRHQCAHLITCLPSCAHDANNICIVDTHLVKFHGWATVDHEGRINFNRSGGFLVGSTADRPP